VPVVSAVLGTAGVALGLAGCLVGLLTVAVGIRSDRPDLRRLSRPYALLALAGAVLAFGAMELALLSHDFSLEYVARNHSRATPFLYQVATLWAALEGSIILWTLVLAGFVVAAAHRFRDRLDDRLVAWAMVTMFAVAAFFFALMLGPANPFTTISPVPSDGPGPNPLLQDHPLMAIHPPMLYLGYVGFTVPFAFCIAALVTGRVGEGWLAVTRRWTLVAWGFLTVGIVLGSWWSYETLGWGGFWAWDPVENASFLPWLTGTAYLHSVMVQERRGMLRVWNLSLLLATFSLTILGTFLTRSGVLDSVHAFSESDIGLWFISLFAAVVLVSLGLIGWRGDRLRAPGRIDSPVSREGAFLANNVLFAAFAFVVLLGTVFPLLHEALRGEQITVGTPYFDRMTMPIGMALLFLMAVAPALPWRKASGEVLRHRLVVPAWIGAATMALAVLAGGRGTAPVLAFGLGGFAAGAAGRQMVLAARASRRAGGSWAKGVLGRANGGMVVHIGVVVVALAFTSASSWSTSDEVRLAEGETASVAGHTVEYLGLNRFEDARKATVEALVRVDGGDVHRPALHNFPNAQQTIGTPSVVWGYREDVYLALSSAPERDGGDVVLRVIIEPLVSWLWIGGGLMALGTLLALVPGTRRRPTAPSSVPWDEADVSDQERAPAAS
jgi:cytochrome c-type biogenesis protein CcmF